MPRYVATGHGLGGLANGTVGIIDRTQAGVCQLPLAGITPEELADMPALQSIADTDVRLCSPVCWLAKDGTFVSPMPNTPPRSVESRTRSRPGRRRTPLRPLPCRRGPRPRRGAGSRGHQNIVCMALQRQACSCCHSCRHLGAVNRLCALASGR
jgi:hypothetical protein